MLFPDIFSFGFTGDGTTKKILKIDNSKFLKSKMILLSETSSKNNQEKFKIIEKQLEGGVPL